MLDGGLGHGVVGATASAIAAEVRAGRLSALQVVDAHLERIAALDGRVGAFEVVRAEQARAEAAELNARGNLDAMVLAGVPVAVKDVVDVTGLPTRHGSAAVPDDAATSDSEVVRRLRAAGAIVVGKTRCPELSVWGVSDNAFGVARNPWDLSRTPGGSSGGSAAAVAAGMVPIALGSDGMGSIRIPAACCGVTGIKPGSGVVPMQFGDDDEHWSGMTQFGPLGTTVADIALMLDVLAGGMGLSTPPTTGSLRIAVHAGPALLGTTVSRPYRAAVADAANALRQAGHAVVAARPPIDMRAAVAATARWTVGTGTDAEVLGARRSALEARTRGHIRVGRVLGRVVGVRAAQADRFRARVAAYFADVDVLITPGLLRAPIRAEGWRDRSWLANFLGNVNYASLAAPWNLADVPAAMVPMGRAANGMATAVQIVAPHGREDLVLAVAAELEDRRPWTRHAPLVG